MAPKKRKVVRRPRVLHKSCVDGMKSMRDTSVDLVIADPPYGIGIASWDGADGYTGFAKTWLMEAVRILQPGGTLLFFSSPSTIWSSRMNVFLEDELKMKHEQSLTWIYAQGNLTPVHSHHTLTKLH